MTSIPAPICRTYLNNFKLHYLTNKRHFWIFYCIPEMCMKFRAFSIRGWVSKANDFQNYWCWKTRLLTRLKRSCLRTPLANECVNGFQRVLKSARNHYYPLFSSIRGKLSSEKSALVWCEILSLFVYAWTADDNYSRQQYAEFMATISNAITSETNLVSGFFIAFLKCAWNLEHFQKKDEHPGLIISEIIDAEKLAT